MDFDAPIPLPQVPLKQALKTPPNAHTHSPLHSTPLHCTPLSTPLHSTLHSTALRSTPHHPAPHYQSDMLMPVSCAMQSANESENPGLAALCSDVRICLLVSTEYRHFAFNGVAVKAWFLVVSRSCPLPTFAYLNSF